MDRPLRITFLNSWHTDRVRGSGTAAAIETFASGLRGFGHEIRTLTPGIGTRSRTTGPILPFLARRALYNLRVPRALSDEAGGDPDVVVGFDADGVRVSSRQRRYPYVVALKGVAADEARFESGWPRIQLTFLGKVERRNAGAADLVMVPSRYSAGVVEELYRVASDRIVVVPEAIDPAPWEALREKDRTADGAVSDQPPTILTVGRQYPRKNTARLIRALPLVRERIPAARLRVIGGGPCLDELRALAADLRLGGAVALGGPVATQEEVRAAFLAADVFAMPSLQEGFGIVFLEAMASGTPVVAGRAGAAPEVVLDGETGLLVEPESPEAIAEAIVSLLEDAPRRAAMGSRGIERAARFTPAASARRFLDRVPRG